MSPRPAPPPKGNPRDDLIPRGALFGNPERENVSLSPDGNYLSWLAPSDGVMNVWVAPADKLDQAKAVSADRARPVSEYYWTYDGQHLIYLQDKGGDENFHLFRVQATGGDTQDLTPVAGARASLYALSPRKASFAIVGINDRNAEVFDVYRIDLRSGARELVLQNDQKYVGFVFDDDLNLRLASQMPADGSVQWFSQDLKTKAWHPYDQIPADDVMMSSYIGFDKSGKNLYASDSRGRNTAALVRVDFASKKSTVLLEDARVDLEQVLTHPTEHTVQAVLLNYDRPRWVALDKSIQRDIDGIAALESGQTLTKIVSRTLDDKTWIVYVASDRASPKYYRWNRAKQQGEFLFSTQPALDGQPLVAMHPVVIPARDTLPLMSYLSLPSGSDKAAPGKPDAPLPLVLLVHGGPWGRDIWHFDRMHQLLANRGYAVLSVNFRGSTGFGKDYVNRGNKQWGKQMHDDLLDAVKWAVEQRIAQQDKVCIMGGSYGGYATLAGLTLTPDTFACGVDLVGPSNIVSLLQTIPPYWAPMISLFHTRVGDPTTAQGKADLLAVSPLTYADRIKRPLLIAQGANDPRVKKAESDQIVAAMQAKGIPVGYLVFPDEGHGFARPENDVAFTAVTEAFLSVHLGGYYQPLTQAELAASSLNIEAGRDVLPALPDQAR